MIWLVWEDVVATEADAKRIEAATRLGAAERWAEQRAAADPARIHGDLDNGLDLLVQEDGHRVIYYVRVEAEAEASIVYRATAVGVALP